MSKQEPETEETEAAAIIAGLPDVSIWMLLPAITCGLYPGEQRRGGGDASSTILGTALCALMNYNRPVIPHP